MTPSTTAFVMPAQVGIQGQGFGMSSGTSIFSQKVINTEEVEQ